MTKQNQPTLVLPARFRLQDDQLNKLGVHVFTSHWRAEADALVKQLDPRSEKRANIRLFNQAVLALSPVLVHGFRYTGGTPGNPVYQMLALDKYPGVGLISSLSRHWADIWLETTYNQLTRSQIMRHAQKLYDLIDQSDGGWVGKSALEALTDSSSNVRYSALPSLIAAKFASSGPCEVNGRVIHWGLLQQEDQALAVVSEPQTTETGATFAYLIRFGLQYQPGNPKPWIHATLTCQRYMDDPLISGNKGRDATILLRLSRPLHQKWTHNQTLVRLPVWNVYGKSTKVAKEPKFPDGLHALLDKAQARQIIRDPQSILENPNRYRRTADDDQYYILYAEGYEPGHQLGSGFSARERTEVFRHLTNRLGDLLIPGDPIPAFKSTFSSRALAPWKMTEKNAPKEPASKRTLRIEAIQSATDGRPIRFLLLSHSVDMGKTMRLWLERRHFRLEEGETLPEQIAIQDAQIPDGLFRPLELSDNDAIKTADRRVDAEQKMASEWQKFLHQFKGDGQERIFAWIELPDAPGFTSPHDAVRMACVKEGFASQMIRKLRSKYDYLADMGKYNQVSTAAHDYGRLYNACGDLAIRQMGIARGDGPKSMLCHDYKKAGFSVEIAEKLVSVGLTIFNTHQDTYHRRGAASFPIAVRILPAGLVEAKIPSVCDWTNYSEAALILGEVFIRSRRKSSFVIDRSQTFKFIQETLADLREIPTLYLLDALKLRQVWPYMKVDSLKKDRIDFNGDVYESSSLPNMDMVWLRQCGDGETPQYVATNEYSWHDADDADRIANASLFKDPDANSIFQHYFSVGRLDNNKKADQKAMRHDEGEEMNFRNQQMLEMVPIMGRHPEAAVIAAHLLRSSPAWSIGNTVLPYPIHLANKMVEDMLPLLGVEDFEE